jgi:mannose-1-phosphate guanylyltransferase
MIKPYYAVIMAGGGGTRLWPLSRRNRPKQMLKLMQDRTLFQMAIDRLEGVFSFDKILVVTVVEQVEELHAEVPQIPMENFLIEPMPRGTASVIGLAATAILHRDPEATMAVLTADHFIQNLTLFHKLLQNGFEVAQKDYLVTLGITPSYAATGYGYIQMGELLEEKSNGQQVYRVLKFKEKPTEEVARGFLAQGDHAWNSGMFIWRAKRILDEIKTHMPELHQTLSKISLAWNITEKQAVLAELWPKLKAETIDYGIMEKSSRVAALPAADLGWNDVGSWDSLFEVLQPDENGNILLSGETLSIGTERSLICSSVDGRLVVTIGVKDMVVVDTENAVLVCPRDQAQAVKKVVDLLKQSEQKRYL